MKKITIKNIKLELQKLNADAPTTELILNNISLYNDLVDKYIKGDSSNTYLLYQLNNQIIKQIDTLKRKVTSGYVEEEDTFNKMKKKIETR